MNEALRLLSPVRPGPYRLRNRMVMAPMTRRRAWPADAPTALNAEYYGQCASAGFIIAEATKVSPGAAGYPDSPGIYTDRQVSG